MDLSIIIVNWNSANYLRTALSSVYQEVKGIEFEVIVVDSASFDGSAEMVEREFPQTVYVQSPNNIGFARSNNLGFQRSAGSALLFLNPDTELIGDAVQRMLTHLNLDRKIGVVGCRVLNSDHTVQTACVQAFPTILNQVLDSKALQGAFPKSSLWGTRVLYEQNSGPQDVHVIAGSCLMARREAFQSVGMFCNDYFMYTEDVELCYSIWKAGYRVQHVPDASIIHHGGSSSEVREESNFSTVMQRETIYRFLKKTRGSAYAGSYRIAMGAAAAIRLGLIGASLPLRYLRHKGHSLRPMRKWYRVLRWVLGFEGWTKKVGATTRSARTAAAAG